MKSNKWIEFVKEYSKKHNISYACAITQKSVRDAYYGRTNTTPSPQVEKQKKRITPTLITQQNPTKKQNKENKRELNPDTELELISQYISQDKPFKTTRKLTKEEIGELARMQLSNTFRRQELTQNDKDFILKNKSKYDEEWLKSRGLGLKHRKKSNCKCRIIV